MATAALCGFESGDDTEITTVGGTAISWVTSPVRSGSYALRINPVTTDTASVRVRKYGTSGTQVGMGITSGYMCVYVRVATFPAANSEEFIRIQAASGTAKATLRLNSTGTVGVYDSATALAATSTSKLVLNEWARVEFYTTSAVGASAYELRIDGVTEASGTMTQQNSNFASVDLGKPTDRNNQTIDVYYDDCMVDDTTWVGAHRIRAMYPVAEGNYTGGTGAYTDVDDTPHDSDTTYRQLSVSGTAWTVKLCQPHLVGIGGTIKSAKSHHVVRDTGAVSSMGVRLRSGGSTDTDTTATDPGSTYRSLGSFHDTDPSTGAAWTINGLARAEIGCFCSANQFHRTTHSHLSVSFSPAAPGGAVVHSV